VIPLVEVEPYADPTRYFQDAGIRLPQPRPDSRRPTVTDLQAVLADLDGFRVETSRTSRGLDIDVLRPDLSDWAVIWVTDYDGDDNAPVSL